MPYQGLRNAIGLKSNFAEAHNNLGTTLHDLGKLNEAEATLRRATVLQVDDAVAYNNLGNTLHQLGKLEGTGKFEKSYKPLT